MADHPRQVIRKAVAQRLTSATAAQDRVYATREVPWRKTDLPGISVYTLEEQADSSAIPGSLVRTIKLAVLAVVSVTEKVDDELDALCVQVEAAVEADRTFGATALDAYLAETIIEVTEDQGRPMGAARLTYDVRYST